MARAPDRQETTICYNFNVRCHGFVCWSTNNDQSMFRVTERHCVSRQFRMFRVSVSVFFWRSSTRQKVTKSLCLISIRVSEERKNLRLRRASESVVIATRRSATNDVAFKTRSSIHFLETCYSNDIAIFSLASSHLLSISKRAQNFEPAVCSRLHLQVEIRKP